MQSLRPSPIRVAGPGLLPWAAAVLPIVACACAPSAGAPPDPSVLLAADSAFDAAVAGGGSEAWVEWFDADGAMIQPGVGEIRGLDAIRSAVTYLDDAGTSLRWAPARADIAASGELGWTTGSYLVASTAEDGSVTRGEGRYVSIWRRQPDGAWKVVMDLGNPVGPARDP
jgi:ketosteroid isomerase-like protein